MFHYSQAPVSNRSRMLFAALLAVALHAGLINFEFAPRPVFVPRASLSRSISVSLNRESMVEQPAPQDAVQTAKPLPEKQQEKKVEPEKTVLKNKLPKNPIKGKLVPQPFLPEKQVRQPAVGKVIPSPQYSPDTVQDLIPDADETAKIQESAEPIEPLATKPGEGVNQSGTVQTAYPRYQLNTPPVYPRLARKRGREGTVILQVMVNRDGRVDDLTVETSSGFGQLDRAAISAVKKWHFEPGKHGKERVGMWVKVPVTFNLKN